MSRFELTDEYVNQELERIEADLEYDDQQLRAAAAVVVGGLVTVASVALTDETVNLYGAIGVAVGFTTFISGAVSMTVNKCAQMFRRYDHYY